MDGKLSHMNVQRNVRENWNDKLTSNITGSQEGNTGGFITDEYEG